MKLITLACVWLRFHLFLPLCPIFIEKKLSLSMMVVDWHSACEEYQKKKKKTKRSKRNQAMWLKRPARWKMLQNKAVAWKRTREKKQSPVVLFSERHRRQRLAKLYTWVKLRQQQQQKKKTENKSNQQRNEGEWTNGGEFERVRRVWDCVTIKAKKNGKGYTQSMSNK